MFKKLFALACLLIASGGVTSSAIAQSGNVKDFYRGKNITVIVGYPAAGGYAIYARLLSHYLGKYIAGSPGIVVQFMPGAGGTRAANYLYSVAPKDGTTVAFLGQEIGHFQALGGAVHYDAAKLLPVGRMSTMNSVVAVWHTAGVKSIREAEHKEVLFGATGASSQSYTNVVMMKNLLGYKFRAVQGYTGGPQINLAMERGEVQGRIGNWSAFKVQAGRLFESGKLIVLAEIGLSKSPDLNVPLILDLTTKSGDRNVMRFLSSSAAIGRSVYLPPGVPQARVDALRKAFDSTMKDPGFLSEAAKTKTDLDYMSGSEVALLLKEAVSAKPELIVAAKKALKD
jgi:tripartite-type tricarboxylate transporter receptor subunit TctC